ncbi:MAG: TetR/AcrR family transcriptional regulator [Planctomycetota bacterium]
MIEVKKKDEIAARHSRIVDTAFSLLNEQGLSAVRLDRVAEIIGCTRTTLYQHFANREEMLVEMARRAIEFRYRLFEHAVHSDGRPRERIMAVCVASMVYVDDLPLHFSIEQAVQNESIWERISPERQRPILENQQACMELCSTCVDEAIRGGELPLPAGLTVEQMVERVCFGLWSMAYGGLVIEASSPSLERVGIRDVRSTIHHNCNALLDSFAWEPRYDPIEYQSFLHETLAMLRERAEAMKSASDDSGQPAEREKQHDAH